MSHHVWEVMGRHFYKSTQPSLLQLTPTNTHTFNAQYYIRTGFLILLYRTLVHINTQSLIIPIQTHTQFHSLPSPAHCKLNINDVANLMLTGVQY